MLKVNFQMHRFPRICSKTLRFLRRLARTALSQVLRVVFGTVYFLRSITLVGSPERELQY